MKGNISITTSDARRIALARWIEANRGYTIDRVHLATAASLATLTVNERGPAFDDAVFGEFAEFIAEMPF